MIYGCAGHRPHKLGGYSMRALGKLMALAADHLVSCSPRPTAVCSGMALGWDQAVASAALFLGMELHAFIPFRFQESRWPPESQATYRHLVSRASYICTTSDGGYSAKKMQLRNERLVDSCDRLIALWDGSASGTRNCVEYALNKGKPVDNLWAQWKAAQ